MRKTYLICDECKTEILETLAFDWIEVVGMPKNTTATFSGTRSSFGGFFCSLECLKKHIEKYGNPKVTYAEGVFWGVGNPPGNS